jgi:hypothetical protein
VKWWRCSKLAISDCELQHFSRNDSKNAYLNYAGLPLPRFPSISVRMTPKYIPVTLRWYKYHTWPPNYVAQMSRLIYQPPSHSQAIAEISGPMIHDKTPLLESIEQSCSGRTGLQYAKLSWTTNCLIISTTSTIREQNFKRTRHAICPDDSQSKFRCALRYRREL